MLRADGRPTYQLASVVDDVDLGITHVIRGTDHLDNSALHAALTRALGAEPPEYIHHGLLLGPDGTKLSKRHGAASLADLRERGIPAEAVRAYLEELGLPKHDVHYDEQRLRRLAVDALAALSDEELAGARRCTIGVRAGAARRARSRRGARAGGADLLGARLRSRPNRPTRWPGSRELRAAAPETLDLEGADELLGALRKGGADLRALRLALTGEPRGPELRAVIAALSRDEALGRAARRYFVSSGPTVVAVARNAATVPEASPRSRRRIATSCGARHARVGDLDQPQLPGRDLVGDRGLGEERDAEAELDHLLRGVDRVQLHDGVGLHPGRAEERVRELGVARRAVELDELLARDLLQPDLPALGEAVGRVADEHEPVLVERRRDDVGVAQDARQPEVDLLAQDEVEHLLGMAGAHAHRTRGWAVANSLSIVGSEYVESAGAAPSASRPAPPRSNAFTICRPSESDSSARTAKGRKASPASVSRIPCEVRMEELGRELLLQPLEPRRQGRLGDEQRVGRAADARRSRDLDETLDLRNLHIT